MAYVDGDGGNSRLTVERIYQKKTPLEHVLLRPDTYIGSAEPQEQEMWVYDGEETGMVYRKITFVPGLYKIFDEILVNAADNKQRDPGMDIIRVDIKPEENKIVIYNNGKGIPVVEHKDEKMYVPTMIFGHLLTSSNYDDNERKVTGGRNGYGAKLCNIFSNKFVVETSSKEYKLAFKQTWTNNMSKPVDAKIVPATGDDFTRVTFFPDLSKFRMDRLDEDIVALFSRRVWDIAGSTKGVKVYLNGKRLPVKNFKDYVDLYIKDKIDENGSPLKMAYEDCHERWQIAVTLSDRGFQQVSFVNSIATTKGGRHVDHVVDQIIPKLTEAIKKKNKAKVDVKPHMIKSHLWVFVNCLVENPSFDSQTKENMTLQMKKFGSKCSPSDKFFNSAMKIGIVEAILVVAMAKAEKAKGSQCSAKKQSRLLGIPKLEDANDAGGPRSIDCTLILTEGDSAKSLVNSGFSVIGRDKYGVFPLKGKLLNVREANHKQILNNAEIQNLIKITGLDYRKKYESEAELKTLRYGKLMIMTDQDQDGSHIKGLLINFIHHNWPNLVKLPYLEEFITPIVRARKGTMVKSFYSLPELEEWKKETPNWKTWNVKYYKGLGTSTGNEAKEYFSDLERHRILFKYQGPEDDHSVLLAFSKKMVDQRKDWLTNSMEDRKRRRELGLPEVYLYGKETKTVTYKDFVNKELVLFSNLDNERSIPSMMDGLKPGQRKVLYSCFFRNLKKEIKVAQLAGTVGEVSCYHHGEASLMATIINLAQNFVGSNNINLLMPLGQFGTRLLGGKDAASPRYIFTKLSPLARKIFPILDDPLLNYLYDDNSKVEPEYYVPVLPMVLVNGAEGIGTGWSTKIPNFNPRDLIENLKRLISGDELKPLKPWFKGFRGSIDKVDHQRYVVSGEVSALDDCRIEITELPVRTWTQSYKENVLEPMLRGTDKTQPFITDYKEYHTDVTVKFVISMTPENLARAEEQGIHKVFKLQTTFSTTSMVLFDHNGCIRKYETPEDILKEFYEVRLEYYQKRKAYLEGMLEAEALKLMNQARFILEKNDGRLKLENVKKKDLVRTLIERGYDTDPVKAWKAKNNLTEGDFDNDEDERVTDEPTGAFDYDYLLDMTMRCMLKEKVDELLKQRDTKKAELDELRQISPETLWLRDLDDLLIELYKVEDKEKEDAEKAVMLKSPLKSQQTKGKGRKANLVSSDTKPSENARKIPPTIDYESYKKKDSLNESAKKILKKTRGIDEGRDDEDEENKDSDDDLGIDLNKSLAERIGLTPEMVEAKRKSSATKSDTPKVAKPRTPKASKPSDSTPKKKSVNGSKTKKKGSASKGKSKNPWSSGSEDEDETDSPPDNDFSDDDFESYTTPVKKPKVSRRSSPPPYREPADSPPPPLEKSADDRTDAPYSWEKESIQEAKSKVRFNSGSSVDSLSLKPVKTSQNVTSEQLFDTVFGSKPSNSSNLSTSNKPSSPYSVSPPSPSSPEPILQSSSQRSYSPDISTNGKNHETVDISSPQPHLSTSKSVNGSSKEPKKTKVKATPAKRKKKDPVSDDSDFEVSSKKSKKPSAKKPARKPKKIESSDSEASIIETNEPPEEPEICISNFMSSTRMGRSKKPIRYDVDLSTDEDDY